MSWKTKHDFKKKRPKISISFYKVIYDSLRYSYCSANSAAALPSSLIKVFCLIEVIRYSIFIFLFQFNHPNVSAKNEDFDNGVQRRVLRILMKKKTSETF